MLIQELMQLCEARRPDLPYNEKRVKDKLDRVTVTLAGTESAVMSRVAKRYERLERSMEAMKVKRDELNERLKDDVGGLFDAEDAVITRVVETVSFTLTLAKEVKKAAPTVKRDYEAIAAELAKLIPEELQAKIDEITEMYTTIIPPKDPVRKISVSAINEGLVSTIKGLLRTVAAKAKQFIKWGTNYDKKLAGLQQQLAAVKSK